MSNEQDKSDRQRRREEMLVAEYRKRFKDGPIGYWYTYLGGGFEMTHGTNIQFNPDGSGTLWYWGGPDEDPNGEYDFVWRAVAERRIVLRQGEGGPEEIVDFDFVVRYSDYNHTQVCIYQLDHYGIKLNREAGFWRSAYALVHRDDAARPDSRSWWQRLLAIEPRN